MAKAYRTIQPSKYEGKITREAVATAVRSLSERKGSNGTIQIKSVAGGNLVAPKRHGRAASAVKKS